MNKKLKINVPFEEVCNNHRPYVKVAFTDKYNYPSVNCCFLIDTGSMQNILYPFTAHDIDESGLHLENRVRLYDLDSPVYNCSTADFTFTIGGETVTTTFAISPTYPYENDYVFDVNYDDLFIIGSLGTQFLIQHGLVLDFYNYSLHTPCIQSGSLTNKDCSFIAPIKVFNSNSFLIMRQGREDWLVRLRTGAEENIIVHYFVKEKNLKPAHGRKWYYIYGTCGRMRVKPIIYSFHVSHDSLGVHKDIDFTEYFVMTAKSYMEEYVKIYDNPEEYFSPVIASLSARFMSRHGLILDYANKVLYKLRS